MYLILQQDAPEDYVIATGVTTTIRDFIYKAFEKVGIILEFKGEGVHETGQIAGIRADVFAEKIGEAYLKKIQSRIGEEAVKVDPQYFRPTEVEMLIGDATKARTKLSWTPQYELDSLIEDMMQNDIKEMKKEAYVKDGGYRILNYFE